MEDVIAAAREQAGRRGPVHSPLYEWLWRHHDRLAPEFDPPRTPNWREVARTLAAKGIMAGPAPRGGDPAPRPPTAELVRRTWAKVVRDKAHRVEGTTRRGRREAGTPAAASSPALPQAVPTAAPASPARPPPPAPAEPLSTDTGDDDFVLVPMGGPKKSHEGEP